MEKYIYCPRCKTLAIHNRATGEAIGWLCEACNPPLEEYS
jgi:ribosomal protein L37AE/L43A